MAFAAAEMVAGESMVSNENAEMQTMSNMIEDEWLAVEKAAGLHEGLGAAEIIRHFSEAPWFNLGVAGVIVANLVLMGVETDNEVEEGSATRIFFYVLEVTFNAVYVFEIIARVHCKGWTYFCDAANLGDVVIVLLSGADAFVLTPMGTEGPFSSMASLRVLRLFRLVRLFKLMTMFRELWLLMLGLIRSLRTLSWVGILCLIVLYVAGIFATLLIGQDCEQFVQADPAFECDLYFGTVYRSMYSMWQVITLESWSSALARPVVYVQPGLVIFFLLFQFVTTLGLMNVVVGIIVECTMEAAKTDEAHLRAEQVRMLHFTLTQLRHVVELIRPQIPPGGAIPCITKERFCEAFNDHAVRDAMEDLGLVHDDDPAEVFKCFDPHGESQVPVAHFVARAQRLRGTAMAKDLLQFVGDSRRVEAACTALRHKIHEV
eukprot:CAMPEP_0204345394 /NCGR_PEP_ID=MMETSP0469-20131031/26363_1 /ASSEMBLY_ACC=CAM_ASM_000384 /TAXON_ID=2969 /ORGANISM="Oxyrrhis marina" /LENGTH=431 /DNA_ID=CAMNT_0051330829 /DNA_START=22 /DNA_END=1314 /DNA_ORIENTATION=+